MTVKYRWLLPEGIEEILPAGARRVERLRRDLLDLYGRWGYELVMPPFIEFLHLSPSHIGPITGGMTLAPTSCDLSRPGYLARRQPGV